MKKITLALLAICLLLILCGCNSEEDYKAGYDEGYNAGYEAGYDEADSDAEATIKQKENIINGLRSQINDLEGQVETLTSSDYTESRIQNSNTGITVYITETGEKYHKHGCQYLRESRIVVNKSYAESKGYTPCSVCY